MWNAINYFFWNELNTPRSVQISVVKAVDKWINFNKIAQEIQMIEVFDNRC